MSIKNIKVPNIGEFKNVEIIEVLVNKGQKIKKNDPLITIESDKSSVEIPSLEDGTVVSLHVKIGDKVSEGDEIIEIETEESLKEINKTELPKNIVVNEEKNIEVKKNLRSEDLMIKNFSSKASASPKVRKFARELGVDINKVPGSERQGRVIESDVKLFVAAKSDRNFKVQNENDKKIEQEYSHSEFGEVEVKDIPRVKKIEKKDDSQNLRIPKNNELKPEIKKVKKQTTEKREYKIKDYIVYPKHGVGQITEFKKINIGGIDVETYIIKFEKDKANGMVPVNKQLHLRPLSTINQVNKSISILKSKPKIKRSMWSRRAQEYEAKISSGKIYDLAEVVRDLNKGDDLMIEQSYSERQLFEKAYDRILSEFQIVLDASREDTQKKLDKALKRNLIKEIKEESKTDKATSNNPLTVEEPISETEEQTDE